MLGFFKKANAFVGYYDEAFPIILTILYVLMAINGTIQVFVLTHKDWDASVKSTFILISIITFIFFLFCTYLFSYGKHKIGGGDFRFILFPLLLFIVLTIVLIGLNYGIDIFVTLFKTGTLQKKELLIWAAIYLGIPISVVNIHHLRAYKIQKAESVKIIMPLSLTKCEALDIYIKEVKFMNSITKEDTLVDLNKNEVNSWKPPKQKENIRDELKSLNQEILATEVLVPSGTDQIAVSWYSFSDDRLYQNNFPLDLNRFDIRKDYLEVVPRPVLDPSLRPAKTGSTVLRFKHHGELDLITWSDSQRSIIANYKTDTSLEITEEETSVLKNKYVMKFYSEAYERNTSRTLLELEQIYNLENKKFNWSITIDSGEATNVRHMSIENINGEHFRLEKEEMSVFKERHLPSEIEFYINSNSNLKNKKLVLYIYGFKLINTLNKLPAGEMVNFHIKANLIDNYVEFYIKSKSVDAQFNDFKLNINNYDQF